MVKSPAAGQLDGVRSSQEDISESVAVAVAYTEPSFAGVDGLNSMMSGTEKLEEKALQLEMNVR